ncbi:MAG: hypothetical protein ACI4XS_07950 [Bacillus sp. (in: firmicutes)]
MFKRWVLVGLFVLGISVPVSAHLTGAFADFLAIVYDDTTISKLKDEMENTKKQIEELKPKVGALEEQFLEERDYSAEQLTFYADTGLDTWIALLQNGDQLVDILGNHWIMERSIHQYIEELNTLYLQFKQLEATKQSLEGHHQLLAMIEENLQARESFLAENSDLPLEQIANYLDIDWTAEVEEQIISAMQNDAETIENDLLDWVNEEETLPYRLKEDWLNERSELQYFFRQDHLYAIYEQEGAHVIVLGQILQAEEGDYAEFVIEAGFYNGFFLPEELLVELPSFKLHYETLNQLKDISSPYLVQGDGELLLHTK